uniref:Uncharacterized protein n=1 Tax=Arundo donax TaxID=35708 RepID=A0A0A9DDQ5_ARUDO
MRIFLKQTLLGQHHPVHTIFHCHQNQLPLQMNHQLNFWQHQQDQNETPQHSPLMLVEHSLTIYQSTYRDIDHLLYF